jgi:NADH-quinone oxidoreductase subunit A
LVYNTPDRPLPRGCAREGALAAKGADPVPGETPNDRDRVLKSYLPVLVFAGLGVVVGSAFALLNGVLGPRRPSRVKSEPYECGLPSEVSRTFRFGISFYLIAMLFILFDIEVVFLYPVGVILKAADSVFVLVEVLIFVALLLVALVYVWAKGALDWR